MGDLAVPGFYISFVSRFGFQNHTKKYYIMHLVSYLLSICLCIYVVSLGYGGQPALLYIVPALFSTTFILGGIRGEIGALFEGVEMEEFKKDVVDYSSHHEEDNSHELHEYRH